MDYWTGLPGTGPRAQEFTWGPKIELMCEEAVIENSLCREKKFLCKPTGTASMFTLRLSQQVLQTELQSGSFVIAFQNDHFLTWCPNWQDDIVCQHFPKPLQISVTNFIHLPTAVVKASVWAAETTWLQIRKDCGKVWFRGGVYGIMTVLH